MTGTVILRRAGVGLVLLYAAVALTTHHLSPAGFRPLFDGFAPPEPYRWVKPPPERAADNKAPAEISQDIPLVEEGSPVSNITPVDAQVIAGLELGSVPPNPPDTAVRLKVTPVDAATLAPLPPGLQPLSNAYLVSLVYQPSETPVTQLAKDGTIALTAATPGDRLLFSPDGSGWEERPSRPYGGTHGRFTPLQVAGYYLVAGAPPAATPADDDSEGTDTALLVIVAAVPILGAVLVLRPPRPLPAPSRASSGSRSARPAGKRPPPRPAPQKKRKRP